MDHALSDLFRTTPDGLHVIGKLRGNASIASLEHLTCFLPGNLALGAKMQAVGASKSQHYLEKAELLTESCWLMYRRTASGKS